jgi:hypothetical protein
MWYFPYDRTKTNVIVLCQCSGFSWFAQGMCSNYGFYFDRSQVWTDMAFEGVGCHIDYDQGGASGRNFNGPYSIFPRYCIVDCMIVVNCSLFIVDCTLLNCTLWILPLLILPLLILPFFSLPLLSLPLLSLQL